MRTLTGLLAASLILVWMLALGAACTADAASQGHEAEVRRMPTGSYYEGTRLPIDPGTKSILAYVLLGLSVVQFGSIMVGLGTRDKDTRIARTALWTHRVNGVLFATLAIVIAQYCIRILGIYGHNSESPVVLHIATAIPLVLIPLMKIAITTRYRGWDSLLPGLGLTALLLTWATSWIIIIHYFLG